MAGLMYRGVCSVLSQSHSAHGLGIAVVFQWFCGAVVSVAAVDESVEAASGAPGFGGEGAVTLGAFDVDHATTPNSSTSWRHGEGPRLSITVWSSRNARFVL